MSMKVYELRVMPPRSFARVCICIIVMTVTLCPRIVNGDTTGSDIDHVIDAIRDCDHTYTEQMKSFEVEYTIGIDEAGKRDNEWKRMHETKARLIFQNGKWAEWRNGIRAVSPGGNQTQMTGALHRTFDASKMRSAFVLEDTNNGASHKIGHIWAKGDLHSGVNYHTFYEPLGIGSLSDYLTEHRKDITDITLDDDIVTITLEGTSIPTTIISISPKQDFRITKTVTVDQDGQQSVRTVEWMQLPNGIWVPQSGRLENIDYHGNMPRTVSRIMLEPIKPDTYILGRTYEDKVFSLTFDPDTTITDFTLGGLTYTPSEFVDVDVLKALQTVQERFLDVDMKMSDGYNVSNDVKAAEEKVRNDKDRSTRAAVTSSREAMPLEWYGLLICGAALIVGLAVWKAHRMRRMKRCGYTKP